MAESNKMKDMPVNKLMIQMGIPMILSMALQAVYNIVDSAFVGNMRVGSEAALNALTLVFPVQMLMVAVGIGTGVGTNALLARTLGQGNSKKAAKVAGNSLFLGVIIYVVCLLFGIFGVKAYISSQTVDAEVLEMGVSYLRICCVISFGIIFFSLFEKLLQATGRSLYSTIGQVVGAVVNIILDPILIFGMFGIHKFGIAGAAIATVIGQIVAALVVMRKAFVRSPEKSCYLPHIKRIYQLGIPNILMQSAYTFYIFGLNMILVGFSDQAVTALGLYYKWQSFFFIPLGALQTCIVPVISFNYAAKDQERCKAVLKESLIAGMALMFLGTLCFEFLPVQMLSTFSKDAQVIAIGTNGFHYIGVAFIPMVTSLIFPVYFQAIGSAVKSSILTVVRTMVLFVPLGYLFSRFGLQYFWLTFPVTEVLTTLVGFKFYRSQQA